MSAQDRYPVQWTDLFTMSKTKENLASSMENPMSSADFPTYRVSSPKSSIGESTMGIELTQDEKEWLASTMQFGGSHYKDKKIQPWDYVVANNFDFWQGNILKYITRWKDKDGVQDLYKARHYIDKYIELVESNDPSIARV